MIGWGSSLLACIQNDIYNLMSITLLTLSKLNMKKLTEDDDKKLSQHISIYRRATKLKNTHNHDLITHKNMKYSNMHVPSCIYY